MKNAGLLLLTVALVLYAAQLRKSMALRVRELERTLAFLQSIRAELSFSCRPWQGLLAQCSHNAPPFVSVCVKLCETMDFPVAWQQALEGSPSYVRKKDKQLLLQLGAQLGTTDAAGQCAAISLYSDLLGQSLEESKRIHQKYGGLCLPLGLLAGLTLCILFW